MDSLLFDKQDMILTVPKCLGTSLWTRGSGEQTNYILCRLTWDIAQVRDQPVVKAFYYSQAHFPVRRKGPFRLPSIYTYSLDDRLAAF